MLLRKLSSLEKYFYYRCILKLHSCFYLGVTLNKIPTKTQLFFALRETIKVYSQLHYNTSTDTPNNEPFLKNISESITLDDVIEYKDCTEINSDVINSMFKDHYFEYGTNKPLWKIIIIPETNQMYLLLSHVLFDGMSSTMLWTTIMSNLQKVSTDGGTNKNNLIIYSGDSMTETILNPHPYDQWPIPWSWKVKRTLAKVLLSLAPNAIVGISDKLLQFKNYSFPEGLLNETMNMEEYSVRNDNDHWILNIQGERMTSILKKCKEEKVSLNSFLVSLFALSLNNASNDSLKEGRLIEVSIPMNTRSKCKEFLDISDSELMLGDFIAGIEYKTDLELSASDDKFWDFARDVQETVKSFADSKFSDAINTAKLLDVVNIQDFIERKVQACFGVGPSSTFEVSNLGTNTFGDNCDETSEFFIKDAFFEQPQSFSSIFTCSVVSTPIGGLTCCVSSPKSILVGLKPVWSSIEKYLDTNY